MFDSVESLKEIDVSKWNTSNIIDMSRAFWGTLSLKNLDVSKWDTSKTTNMSRFFGIRLLISWMLEIGILVMLL